MRLLVIEDERDLCEDIAKKLRLSGYEADICFDGEAALELLAVEKYDLVLLDLNLPKVDGMTVLRPSVVDTSTLCGWLVNAIYSADTPTNVLPSMHVVGCMAVLAVTFDSKYLKKVRIPAVIIAVAICAATVFVKQHSILDVFAALALSLVLYLIIYVAARTGRSLRETEQRNG